MSSVPQAGEESKGLKEHIYRLERENRDLRRSVFDLNLRIASIWRQQSGQGPQGGTRQTAGNGHFDIDGALKGLAETNPMADAASARAARSAGAGKRAERQFGCKAKLKGHSGAVYCGRFSPCGKFIATGSLDATVRLWDVDQHHEISVCTGHQSGISDISWGRDSNVLLTGSYDKSLRLWDIETAQPTFDHSVKGLVQTVALAPGYPNMCFAGTSRKELHLIDIRSPDSSIVLEHDAVINTLYPYRDAGFLTTGDSSGRIITWDIRARQALDLKSERSAAISHISISAGATDHEEGKYMAVNAYDNTVRLYDRGPNPAKKSLDLLCTATGHVSKNWPIRCSVFHDSNAVIRKGNADLLNPDENPGKAVAEAALEDVLMACGSADNDIHVFHGGSTDGVAPLLQRLKGHTGRVYSVHFHPTEPLLLSCSEDTVGRIWALEGARRTESA